ncbi:MAG: hypothetical protein MN733_35285, partial [Nitrososphaera sp.]|nr:hypothetical protein [Nitrososphaera sp.]
AGGLKADAVLNRHGKKQGYVSIDFVGKDGTEYRVTRKRPAELVLEREGKDVSSKTAKDTQEAINKVLGVDFKTFVQTSFFGQGRNLSYPSLTPSEQKAVLEQILPMEQVDQWAQYAEAKYKEVSKLATQIQGELGHLNTQTQTLQNERDIAISLSKDFHFNQQQEIYVVDKKLADLDKTFADDKARLEVLESQIANIDLVEIGQQQAAAKEQMAQFRVEIQPHADKQLAEANSSRDQWLTRRSYLIKEMDTITKAASCPTCLRPYDNQDDIESRKNTTAKLIEEANVNVELAVQAAVHYSEVARNIRNDFEVLVNKVRELDGLVSMRSTAEYQIKEINTKISSARIFLEAMRVNIQNRENVHDATRTRLDNQLVLLDARILEVNKRLGAINGEAEHLDYWRNVYSADLKLKLFEDACPFLDSRVAYHLEKLKNNQIHAEFSTVKRLATGKSKEDFNIVVWSETGGQGFDSLSGGEQQMVSFAIGLALSDLASSVSSVSSSFLILDEPFSELDARNSEAI